MTENAIQTGDPMPIIQAENIVIGDGSSRFSSAIFFLLCFIPLFAAILFGGVDNTTWIFITISWAAIVLLWLAETWKGGGFLVNSAKIQLPMIGLLLIGLIQLLPLGGSTANGPLAVPLSNALSLDPYSTRFFLIRLLIYIVFFAACLAFINNERRLKKTVILIIVFGSAMAFFGILQRLANPGGIYGMRETPQAISFGPFVNQHHFAAFMEMTCGVALALLFGKSGGRDKKALLATAVVIMGVAIVLTGSRGGMLSFGVVVAAITLYNLLSGRWSDQGHGHDHRFSGLLQKAAIAASVLAIAGVITGIVLFIGADDSLLRGIGAAAADTDVSTGRFHFWSVAVQIFLAHPFLGVGFNAFGVAFTKYDTWSGIIHVDHAHNEYLQILADAGIAGFICIATFIYFLFREGLATIKSASGFRRDAAVGALAGCLGILVHSFFDFPLRTPSNGFFFLLLCTVAIVSIQMANDGSPSRRRRSTSH